MQGFAPGWQVRCPKCRLTFDAGDLGFVFVGKKLVGKQFKLLWCQQCRWPRWFIIEQKSPVLPGAAGPRCDISTHAKPAVAWPGRRHEISLLLI